MSHPHVLLTGANGFVASHILAILIDVRHTVLPMPLISNGS